jgi:polyisoprenoid-binding protein YceI
LQVKRFPTVTFTAADVAPTSSGYRLTGTLEIHGTRREHVVDVTVTDNVSCRSQVRQTDFGITPYSLMMGSLRVADAVTVVLSASATGSHRAG